MNRQTSELELQEFPPLIYQLLLLSTHGHRQTILVCPLLALLTVLATVSEENLMLETPFQEMILDLFNQLDSKCNQEVVHTPHSVWCGV